MVFLVGVFSGAAVWWLSLPITGSREPWDYGGAYYPIAIALSGAIAALTAPRYWWMAPIGIFVGEHLYSYLFVTESRPWLLFGLYIHILTPRLWVPSILGAGTAYIIRKKETQHAASLQ